MCGSVLDPLQKSYSGKRQTDQKRVAVVELAKNEGAD